MANCSCCPARAKTAAAIATTLKPIICLVPKAGEVKAQLAPSRSHEATPAAPDTGDDIPILDHGYIEKNFNLPPRSLYLDPNHRPLISFPMTQEDATNFNIYRKAKTNQQILDGYLTAGEAVELPSVFPYGDKVKAKEKQKSSKEDEETIYILQLPDWEYHCPVHNKTIRTPRFLWHSNKAGEKSKDAQSANATGFLGPPGGPLPKPKPWILSRHTDFDLMSQW